MQLGQDASGRSLTGYQRRSLGIDPPLNPMLVKMLVAQGLHVSGVNDRAMGGRVGRARMAHQAPGYDLNAMGGGLNAIPGPALEGGPDQAPAQPGNTAMQQAAMQARLQQMQQGQQPVMHPQDVGRVQNVAQNLMRRLAMHRQLQGLLAQQRSAYPAAGAARPVAPAGPVGGHFAQ